MESYPIQINNLSFKYSKSPKTILNNINLKVSKSETIAIVGLSGCGKTTLIQCLNGIIPKIYEGDYSGQVLINGEDIKNTEISELATQIGTVFQDPDTQIVFSTVEDELAFGPENLCIEPFEIKKRIDEISKLLNITKLIDRNPNNLSGGEKQLVVLGSVLTLGVEVLILDECMSQVDEKGKKQIRESIRNLKAQGKTIVMIEHDFKNLSVADRVLNLTDGKLTEFTGDI